MDAPTVTASATPPSLPEPPVAKRARTVDSTLLEDWPTSTARAALAASARAERATVVAAEIAARAAPAPDRTFETCRDATAVLELYASFAGDAAETSPARSLRTRAADPKSPAKSPKPPKQLFADK